MDNRFEGDATARGGGPTSLRVSGLQGSGNLVDPGGSVDGVPEPASWALMMIGFGGIGPLLRRGRIFASQPV